MKHRRYSPQYSVEKTALYAPHHLHASAEEDPTQALPSLGPASAGGSCTRHQSRLQTSAVPQDVCAYSRSRDTVHCIERNSR